MASCLENFKRRREQVHTPDELEVVENQQPIDDVVIKD